VRGRAVLKRLLGNERLRVRPDDERGFAVGGEFRSLVGGGRSEGSSDSVVAGMRYAPFRARLPVQRVTLPLGA